MDSTDMLIKAHNTSAASATANPGEETAGTCWSDGLSPIVEAMTFEELDAGGSEFSWSSVASGQSPSSPYASAAGLGASGEEVAEAKETPPLNQTIASTGRRTEDASAPSIQKHSLYFWESITFKVDGVVFQLPKYRFVEESDVFMEMVKTSEGDGVIELDVTLVEFESFLKAFLPRASAMYDWRPILTQDEWIDVLKLSSKWLFNDLRQLAIEHLHFPFPHPGYCHITDPIERICLAKEYHVYDWLIQGYEQVIERLLTSDNPDGSPMTLTAQEGKRIGMDVALELSGIAIRRVRLDERKDSLMDARSDVLDAFKEEFDCVREGGARFMTRAELLEEEARKADKEAEAEIKRKKEAEEESLRLVREAESKEEAEKQVKRQEEEGRSMIHAKEPEVPAPNPERKIAKKKGKLRRVVKLEEVKEPKLEQQGTKPLAAGSVTWREDEEARRAGGGLTERLENENAKRLEEEEIKKLKEERAKEIWKQWDEEEKKVLKALAEEGTRRIGPIA
ncbi:hypothetical protein BKA70DRAFT_1160824 [Coprinopsis sp. MPI-PUGE-AT-0042]|nr:hypothetical protein BKA70DRAFT_1160824 [Coprinopsis sp. MPI-PUGE-AT-0042]